MERIEHSTLNAVGSTWTSAHARTCSFPIRSLDAGCLGYLLNRDEPEIDVVAYSTDGFIEKIEPTEVLARRFYPIADRLMAEFSGKSGGGGNTIGDTQASQERNEPSHAEIDPEQADDQAFDPLNIDDARERIERTIVQRRGQRAFRDGLIKLYRGRCAVTGCGVLDILEAAHIYPYRGIQTNALSNGLLLRADIHTLFDCSLLLVNPETLKIEVSPKLRLSEYDGLDGKPLNIPDDAAHAPSIASLKMKYEG
jgi:hypothetical protein